MANAQPPVRFKDLRLDTDFDGHRPWAESESSAEPGLNSGFDSGGSLDATGAFGSFEEREIPGKRDIDHESTAPINIQRKSSPQDIFQAVESQALTDIHTGGSRGSSTDNSLHHRPTTISFSSKVKLSSGDQRPIDRPLEKEKSQTRGRSIFQELADDLAKSNARSQSEGDKDHCYTANGHLPSNHDAQYHWHDKARRGEGRYPLLQETVDELPQEVTGDQLRSLPPDSIGPSGSVVRTPPELNQSEYISGSSSADGSVPNDIHSWQHSRPRRIRTSESMSPNSPLHSWGSVGPRTSTRSSRPSSRRSISAGFSPAFQFLRSFSVHEEKPPSPDDAGQTVGDDYVLGRQIGHGGFSTIKEAFQMDSPSSDVRGRLLAVKIVRHALVGRSEADNELVRAEFDHEVELWRFLRHRRLLELEAVYKTDFATFCFMPINKDGTLFDLVSASRQGLRQSLAKNLAFQLADALRYLHEDRKIAHRDIKLENCLIEKSDDAFGQEYNLRLCDFGMAEWLSAGDGLKHDIDRPPAKSMGPADSSSSAFVGGSLEYAAPEILRLSDSQSQPKAEGERELIDAATPISSAVDIWAYGVCVYAMILRNRPFPQNFEFPRKTWNAIVDVKWNKERLLEKGGHEVLDLVENGCLVQDINDRWIIGDVLRCRWLEGQDDGLGGGDAWR
ncbi:MAG: hypothetical protein Q9227_005526 [Pyrenula ochraceoflavens]